MGVCNHSLRWLRCLRYVAFVTYTPVTLCCMRCVRCVEIVIYRVQRTERLRCVGCVRLVTFVAFRSLRTHRLRCVACVAFGALRCFRVFGSRRYVPNGCVASVAFVPFTSFRSERNDVNARNVSHRLRWLACVRCKPFIHQPHQPVSVKDCQKKLNLPLPPAGYDQKPVFFRGCRSFAQPKKRFLWKDRALFGGCRGSARLGALRDPDTRVSRVPLLYTCFLRVLQRSTGKTGVLVKNPVFQAGNRVCGFGNVPASCENHA